MLVARAFVLSVNKRALLAVAVVGLSVAYALLAAAAASGLKGAGEALSEEALAPGFQVVAVDGTALPGVLVDAAEVVVWEAGGPPLREGTIEPWPYGDAARSTPYVNASRAEARAKDLGTPYAAEAALPHAAPGVLYLPPETFHARHPEAGAMRAYFEEAPAEVPPGTVLLSASGAEAFYVEGASQVATGLFLLVVGSGVIVAVLAAGVTRLEVLARRQDFATLEALGGRQEARRAVVLRVVFLVAVGDLLGVLAAFGVVDLLRSGGGQSLSIGIGWTLLVLAVTTVAGVAAGSIAGLRSFRQPLAARLGRRGLDSRPFPGPVRFLAVSPRVFAGIVGAAFVTTTLFSVVLGAASVPVALFAPDDATVLYGAVTGNPFRGSADRMVAELAHRFDGIEAASGETYAPTVAKSKPLLVRGVDPATWPALTGARLEEGRWPAGASEATLGVRAARALGVGVGQELLVPASYTEGALALEIVGIHARTGFSDDEAVTTLDAAGYLAGIPNGATHAIRIRVADPAALDALSFRSTAVVLDVAVEGPVVPLTNATVKLEVANFASEMNRPSLVVRVNDQKVQDVRPELPPRSVTEVRVQVLVPEASTFNVEVNPSASRGTTAPELRVEHPARADPNGTVAFTVRDNSGDPVAGAIVTTGTAENRTNEDGLARLTTGPPGLITITTQEGARRGGALLRVAPAEWDNRSVLVAEDVFVEPRWSEAEDTFRLQADARVANLGGTTFQGNLTWEIAGNATNTANFTLRSGARTTVGALLTTEPGSHNLTVLDRTVRLDLADPQGRATPGSQAASLEELFAAREQAAQASASPQERTQALLQDTFEELETATALVLLVTALHTGAAVWVSVVREVRERSRILDVMHRLGADRGARLTRAVRDALLSTLPAALVGIVAAYLVLAAGHAWGFPAVFGHAIPVALDPAFALRVATIFLVVAAAAAYYAVATSGDRPMTAAARRPLTEILEESP